MKLQTLMVVREERRRRLIQSEQKTNKRMEIHSSKQEVVWCSRWHSWWWCGRCAFLASRSWWRAPGGGAGAARGGCRRWVPGCGFLKGVVPQILLSVLNSGEVQHSVPARDVMAVERSGDRGYVTVLPGGGGGDDAGWV